MDELAQPEPETPETELARLRQQLAHYEDVARQQQAAFMGQYATGWGPVNPFHLFGPEVVGEVWASSCLTPLTPVDAEALVRYDAEQTAFRERQQAALTRALSLLEEKVGATKVAKIQAGGGFEIPSTRWPMVVYLVPRDPNKRIKVLADGEVVTEVCIVSTENALPWPDIMLHRITAIQADESILFATGVLHPRQLRGRLARLQAFFRRV